MVIKLYFLDVSPPVRSVLLTAKALNLELELVPVDLISKEHKAPQYKKMNPQGTVPTMDDDGFILWESHAIITYLTERYGRNDYLYPKELKKRAVINQRLHFNGAFLQPRMRAILRRLFLGEISHVPAEAAEDVKEAYQILEAFLADNEYMTGNELTLADFSLVASISSLDPIVPIDTKACPNLKKWLHRMEELPFYQEANGIPLQKYISVIKNRLSTK